MGLEPTCSNCMFRRYRGKGGVLIHECRRNPPVGPSIAGSSPFCEVKLEMWCAEHVPGKEWREEEVEIKTKPLIQVAS